ncbi:hypothetical protein TRVL_10163 [Trypanosoma vivax]|nr:hypothetical protein TRVL_10163 [Trypanosoma vivax]
MLFLLFLFLGTLGTQASEEVAVCDLSKGSFTCSRANCTVAKDGVITANITCNCTDGNTGGNCALNLHGSKKDGACFLTVLGETPSCTSGEKLCNSVGCTDEGPVSDPFQVECQCKNDDSAKAPKNKGSEKSLPRKSTDVQNADQLREVLGTQNSTEVTNTSDASAGQSAAAHNSQKVAFPHPLLPFIAVILRRN